MKKCHSCNEIVATNEKNCPYCGEPFIAQEYCPKCNSIMEGEPDFCSNCGQQLRIICKNCRKKIVGSPKTCPYCQSLIL